MQGRSTFTRAEIDQLRGLIREKQTADRDRQKVLRNRMRRIGFFISDFAYESGGFVVSDLDELIARGRITITDDTGTRPPQAAKAKPQPAAISRTRESSADGPLSASDDDKLEHWVDEVIQALAHEHAELIVQATSSIPRHAGLYAIHGRPAVWKELGLGTPPDERPLYVGKAEQSLLSRDVDTHFGNGRTGSSTVRRSFAALLRERLGLEGRPRNPAKPERFANYGLAPEHDRDLTDWMQDKLTIAVWPRAARCTLALAAIEQVLLQMLKPPLNLAGVATPWSAQVSAARRVMADQARSWSG